MSVEQNISEELYVCRYNCIEITGCLYKIYERIKIYALKTLRARISASQYTQDR